MSKPCWIGVDLSKDGWDASSAGVGEPFDRGRKVYHFTSDAEGRRAFVDWVTQHAARQELAGICLESTGRLSVQFALDLGPELPVPVSIVEPSRPRQFARSLGLKQKTDRVDARVLAQFGAAMQPAATRLPEADWRELKECSRLMETLQADRKAYEQRLPDAPESEAVRRELALQAERLTQSMVALEAEIARLQQVLPGVSADVARMTSIPGVGPKTSSVILSEFGDLRQYKRDELVGYSGLYPVHFDSGTSVHKPPRRAKGGGARVRRVLYRAAMSARRHAPHRKAFADRRAAAGKEKRVVLCAVMRKLLLLIRAVVVTGQDYDPRYA